MLISYLLQISILAILAFFVVAFVVILLGARRGKKK